MGTQTSSRGSEQIKVAPATVATGQQSAAGMAGDGFGGRDGAAVQLFDGVHYVGHVRAAKLTAFRRGVAFSALARDGRWL